MPNIDEVYGLSETEMNSDNGTEFKAEADALCSVELELLYGDNGSMPTEMITHIKQESKLADGVQGSTETEDIGVKSVDDIKIELDTEDCM